MPSPEAFDHARVERDVLFAAGGDRAALVRVTEAVLPVLSQRLSRFRLTAEDHQDVLQNTLLRIQQRLGDFRGEARFLTWASRVASNEALMFLRSQRRHRRRDASEPTDLDLIAAPPADGSHQEHFDEEVLRAAFTELPSLYECVLFARYAQDASIEAIARDLSTTKGSVRATLMRARQFVRARLARDGRDSLAAMRA